MVNVQISRKDRFMMTLSLDGIVMDLFLQIEAFRTRQYQIHFMGGPHGSGKGFALKTLGEIAKARNQEIIILECSSLLVARSKDGDSIGAMISDQMNLMRQGRLFDDRLAFIVILEAILNGLKANKSTFLVDGFPRNHCQFVLTQELTRQIGESKIGNFFLIVQPFGVCFLQAYYRFTQAIQGQGKKRDEDHPELFTSRWEEVVMRSLTPMLHCVHREWRQKLVVIKGHGAEKVKPLLSVLGISETYDACVSNILARIPNLDFIDLRSEKRFNEYFDSYISAAGMTTYAARAGLFQRVTRLLGNDGFSVYAEEWEDPLENPMFSLPFDLVSAI